MKLSLGPILYCWTKQYVQDFYDKIKESSVEVVYVGEMVCVKRQELLFNDWLEIARELQSFGKEVVLTSLALVDSPSKLLAIKKAVNNGELSIEANDFSAVNLCVEAGLPFVAGHALNIYNAEALVVMIRNGMYRWCFPVELSYEWLKGIQESCEEKGIWHQFEKEILAYGYLPLSYSARCFTARTAGRDKADCEIECLKDLSGRAVMTQDNERIFTMNGIQMQSGQCYNLVNEHDALANLVDLVRISPLNIGVLDVIEQFKNAFESGSQYSLNENECSGFWSGEAGMRQGL